MGSLIPQRLAVRFVELGYVLKGARPLRHQGTLDQDGQLGRETGLGGKGFDIAEQLILGDIGERIFDPSRVNARARSWVGTGENGPAAGVLGQGRGALASLAFPIVGGGRSAVLVAFLRHYVIFHVRSAVRAICPRSRQPRDSTSGELTRRTYPFVGSSICADMMGGRPEE